MNIKELLLALNNSKGSDLFLAAGNPPTLRIHDTLHKQTAEKMSPGEVEDMLTQIIPKEDMERFKKEKELDTAYQDELSRYRVNLHWQKGSMGAAMRRIPRQIPTLEELKMPTTVKNLAAIQKGLILVTGPTGSGKSTTQASMLDEINTNRACHIVTIEDPIEFVHAPKQAVIEQREVGVDTLSFGEALKRSLRQMPDIILVGEMRDLESIQSAITAAETGHLVISTLHTQDAVQSIDRIVDVFPPHQQPQIRTMLSLTLQGVVSQQLIPSKDGKGLVLALEIMTVTHAIRNIIRKGATQDIYSMIELGGSFGMQSMDSCLANLCKSGTISKEDAIANAVNRERLEKSLGESAKVPDKKKP
jgi:twitching motility protein PilT